MNKVALARFKEELNITDLGVITEQLRMSKHYGYCPAYASNLPDFTIASQQADYLLKAFPGYLWKVQVRDGILTCVNDTIACDFGFNLKVKMLDSDGKVIYKFGAGLLEMYHMRAKYDSDQVSSAKKDLRGNLVRC